MIRSLRVLLLALGALCALLLATPDTASAACPPGSFSSGVIVEGTRVRIKAVSDADAYYPQRSSLVGKTGRVDQMDPTGSGGDCWYGGQFYGDDGSSNYFYQVALEVISGGVASGGGCPAAAYTGSTIASGTRVKVLTVSPEDAYYSTRHTLEGKVGRVDGEWSKRGEACWFAGQFYGDDSSSFYFYQAAVELQSASGPGVASCPPGAATSTMAEGTRVKILAIHGDDAYVDRAAEIIGSTGVVSGDLHPNDGCWMGGGFTADDGTYYYFYKAAVKNMGGGAAPAAASCPPGANTSTPLAEGTAVKVVAVHADDAYVDRSAELIGTLGKVTGDLHSNEGCWMGGGFTSNAGDYYYFYKAAFVVTAPAASGGRFQGAAVPSGQRFRIVALHADDAYYSDRASMIGKTCRATDEMAAMESSWYAGPVTCDDGSEYYFYKVGVVLQ